MKKLFLLSFLIIFNGYSFEVYNKIKPVECKMWRGTRSEAKFFTLHDNYSLFIPFDSLDAGVLADHKGNAGSPGMGYRYVIYVKDPKIGGYKQESSSSTIKMPLATQDMTFDDQKYKIKVRCKGR
ncbi:MAG: hypothetical protein ACHQYQ_00670 [Bacteriovoracales bacterium]